MKICQKHWEMLRQAIETRGLINLVAKNGEVATQNAMAQLQGSDNNANYDPLMAANFRIWSEGLHAFGIGLMAEDAPFDGCVPCIKTDLESKCTEPKCSKQTGEQWIEFAADEQLEYARMKGLVPKAS